LVIDNRKSILNNEDAFFNFGERMKSMTLIFGGSSAVAIVFGVFFGWAATTNAPSNDALAAIFLFWSMMSATISFAAAFFILMDSLYDRS
jgi:hypothetical protein